MRTIALALAIVATLAVSGCYRSTVTTGLPPGTQRVERTAHHFLWGLAGDADFAASQLCGGAGISAVRHSTTALDTFLAWLTCGIYTPTTVEVVCAPSPNW